MGDGAGHGGRKGRVEKGRNAGRRQVTSDRGHRKGTNSRRQAATGHAWNKLSRKEVRKRQKVTDEARRRKKGEEKRRK